MALELAASPESSGRGSPISRQWRNQLDAEEPPVKDRAYRRYAAGVDKALSLFESALEEWADYISFLNKLLKALQARPSSLTAIPSKTLVAKRLSQCLNPSLPSGVHQKALDVYNYIFTTIGKDGLSRDLPLYLPGLAPTLSFASLSVRSPYLHLLETHFLAVDARSLRPALKSIVLALLPGLEDETSDDFDRTMSLVTSFKQALRPQGASDITDRHSSGDDFFWQCFFLACVTGHSRRAGALAYLVRCFPVLGPDPPHATSALSSLLSPDPTHDAASSRLAAMVTSPEPGLLVRCFASGLADDQLLIQRGFLDLLVSHLPLNSAVLQSRVKPKDLQLLLKAAVGVVTRRDMSLNRRLWAWLLGPEPATGDGDATVSSPTSPTGRQTYLQTATNYFEEYGLQPLTQALLEMINGVSRGNVSERARPYRICLSLMDRWEIGGLVIPEVFLPVVQSVRHFHETAASDSEFAEVLRSASVFFDGIESGLIYSELLGLLSEALGCSTLSAQDRADKISLVNFIVANFNVREEDMVTVHVPLTCLAALTMLQEYNKQGQKLQLTEKVLGLVVTLTELIPDRAFPPGDGRNGHEVASAPSNDAMMKKIKVFYEHEQGNLDSPAIPYNAMDCGELLLQKAVEYMCQDVQDDLSLRVRILVLILLKTPPTYRFDVERLLSHLQSKLDQHGSLPFPYFSSALQLATHLHSTHRIGQMQLSQLAGPLVRQAWLYLSASDPKYHVETVRSLWQLQTALGPSNRDIEAALSDIVVSATWSGELTDASVEAGRTFGVLWSHTLQDTTSERRASSKAQTQDHRLGMRLAGMDHYQLMLTQPLFNLIDALFDDRTQLYMVMKFWLNTMIGIDRLFLVLVAKLSELSFLSSLNSASSKDSLDSLSPIMFEDDDDVDLCLYYLRSLNQILGCTGPVARHVLASKHLMFDGQEMQIRSAGEKNEMTLQDYFMRVSMMCALGEARCPDNQGLGQRVSGLQRYSLTMLHEFLSSSHAACWANFQMEDVLINRLSRCMEGGDAYVQVLLFDVICDGLKLQELAGVERPVSPRSEKTATGVDRGRRSRASVSTSDGQQAGTAVPGQLLKCLEAGLSSANSRGVLDGWVGFMGDCLPFYGHGIFQVLIPLVETLCGQIGRTLSGMQHMFEAKTRVVQCEASGPDSTLISLLNGLERVLALGHEQIVAEEARVELLKGPEQPHSLFGSMVSGVFQSDGRQPRSATANDRLTVHLAFQDSMRMCYKIWCWGQGDEAKRQDAVSVASFHHTSMRMRNRARRLLEQLFAAETLECLETAVEIWKSSGSARERGQMFKFLAALDACRPRQVMPALFNAIYSRTNPGALEAWRKSTMTISLEDVDLVTFLVDYARSLDDDAMDEIWQDCIVFLKDLLGNPFPHRQTLAKLLEFAGILGEKVDNTNFGEQRRMRRELGDMFLRLLAALFTTRPMVFEGERGSRDGAGRRSTAGAGKEGTDDIVSVLGWVVPQLGKIVVDNDRVLSAAAAISANVIGPSMRSKLFPETMSRETVGLLEELSRVPNNQKTWKKDVGEAFNDGRFFGTKAQLAREAWLPLLQQWVVRDKERMAELVGRISTPTTAGIVFGVGATSARLEADRKTQLNLRRMATLVVASADDFFVADLALMLDKLVELLGATPTSSPSSATRADVYLVMRALVLKTSAVHLAVLWPVVNAEMHAAMASVVAPDHSAASDTYANSAVLQACKLLDVLVCVAPDDFQLHEWLFVTDTIDAIYRPATFEPVALVDELSDELGSSGCWPGADMPENATTTAPMTARRLLLGPGGINVDVALERRDELVAKVLRPFFAQLTIFAFESTYAMAPVDKTACIDVLVDDVFDEGTIVRAL
ncbi:hypothetical protein CDD82_6219 [Ophiocordyceps australis]|uniref:Uncharacterized protein n=1 Tax=Ophiocordyceps australis TaxID=1399860 RepID=A0A2C5XGX6_9HYPO|nr:hypothetical protein CDD82_6219 [Ophiocordyceps australis]